MKILVSISIIINIVFGYILYTQFNAMKQVAIVLSQSGIIEKGINDDIVINRVVRLVDIQQ